MPALKRLALSIALVAVTLFVSAESAASSVAPLVIDSPAPQGGALFGTSLAAGDIDSDGKDDIAISALFEDVGPNVNQGRAYVFSGSYVRDGTGDPVLREPVLREPDFPDPPSTAPAMVHFGQAVAMANLDGDSRASVTVGTTGDINGNGAPDTMIGCPKESLREGRVYVLYGGGDDGDDVPWSSPVAPARLR